MKGTWVWWVALCSMAVSCGAGETISLRGDAWEPYNGDPDSKTPGFMIEVAKAVFEKAGYTVDYQTKGWTWERSIEEAKKGKVDGIVGAAKDDAPDFIYPDVPLATVRMAFFAKKGSTWKYGGAKSLEAVKLGVISGYACDSEVDDYIEKNKDAAKAVQAMEDDNALELNIKKLAAGRIDTTIEDEVVFWSKAKELGLEKEFIEVGAPPVGDDDDVYIAFAPAKKTSAQYAEILSKGIKTMRESGEFQKLMEKYGLKEVQKTKK